MQTQTLHIEGMMCDACAGHVTRALQDLDGVQAAPVSLDAKTAVVTFDPARVGTAQMLAAVADEGYEATVRA